MSDDAKLFAREKELLQAEILEGKKLLKIATGQIKGLRERMFTLEEENRCLRITYANELKDASKTQTTTDVSNYRERIASLEKQLKEKHNGEQNVPPSKKKRMSPSSDFET